MLQKTHLAVGTAVSLAAMLPTDVPTLVIGTGAAFVGSVICDIDSGSSTSRKEANLITFFIALICVILGVVEYFFHLGIANRVRSDADLVREILCAAVFISVCLIGKQTAHRSFMHSFLCLAVLYSCLAVGLPIAAPYFAVAFFSHQAIDLLNKKGERLLYPAKTSFSLNFCRSDGLVNRILFLAGTIASVAMILYSVILIVTLSIG